MKVTGLREIEEQLLKLSGPVATKILRGAMYDAVKPIVAQAQANAAAIPNGSGALALSISRGSFQSKTTGGFFSAVLPSMGGKFSVAVAPKRSHKVASTLYDLYYHRKRKRRGIFYGHLVEFTHRTRNGGTVGGRPIFGPALQSRGPQAVTIFAASMQKGIDRQLRKANKRRKK